MGGYFRKARIERDNMISNHDQPPVELLEAAIAVLDCHRNYRGGGLQSTKVTSKAFHGRQLGKLRDAVEAELKRELDACQQRAKELEQASRVSPEQMTQRYKETIPVTEAMAKAAKRIFDYNKNALSAQERATPSDIIYCWRRALEAALKLKDET